MNHDEYFKFHDQFCERMSSVTRAKSKDYTGDSGDPFSNFRAVEKLGICSTETGFLVRMMDKMVRIANLADGRPAAVFDEKLEDSLHDCANYCALFAGYLKSKQDEARERLIDEYFKASLEAQGDEYDCDTWPTWEIQARNNRGDTIVLESHYDPEVADGRMRQLESEWPTFILMVVPVNDRRKKTS